ncbi:hypothetical protein TNIN_112851 [Trichonephila inaurata madagascariensis]|uniref:Uncharacterized protein n=1 Tax=Trichonephila inaurata madagascariensis TaxID=2747483 RepID=A0A8X6XPQ1_9ARAC|nr:hypothetical protein TNIN_112851 [Trichonephila inaurata madagascariensis]
MLVGLKRDRRFETDREVQLYIIPEEEANEFGADRGYVAYMEASAQHRSGVDEIFEAAVRIAMEHGLCPKSMWRNKGFRLPNDFPVAL